MGVKPVILKPHTIQFRRDMEALRRTNKISGDKDVYEALDIRQGNFSAMLNGHRNIPLKKVLLFQEKFQKYINTIPSGEVTIPANEYIDMLKRENEVLRAELQTSLASLSKGQQFLQEQIAVLVRQLQLKMGFQIPASDATISEEECSGYEPLV